MYPRTSKTSKPAHTGLASFLEDTLLGYGLKGKSWKTVWVGSPLRIRFADTLGQFRRSMDAQIGPIW